MRIVALVENTSASPAVRKQHGLSLYIETAQHRILFDVGPDDTLFENARTLGIDLETIDTVILSHGHADHGGALVSFLQRNGTARVYAQTNAFEPHRAKLGPFRANIGLDPSLVRSGRVVHAKGDSRIDEELMLVADVPMTSPPPRGNASLLARAGKAHVPDDFSHEQNLLVTQNGHHVLFAGCAHRGILNIIRAGSQHARTLDLVVGGFHLFNPIARRAESPEAVESLARTLAEMPMRYMTCHCTGEATYAAMKGVLGERLEYMASGMDISFP